MAKPSAVRKHNTKRPTKANAKVTKCNTFAKSDPLKVISSRFERIKLPTRLKRDLQVEIAKWYNSNGKAYTVQRLKFVRQCLVKYYADGSLPPAHNEVWFKKNRHGFLAGPWSSLFKLVLNQPKEVLKLASCYTVFATDAPPKKQQINAFKEAVEQPFTGNLPQLEQYNEKLYKHSKHILNKYVMKRYKDVECPRNYLLESRANNDGHKNDIIWQLMDLFSSPTFFEITEGKDWIFDCMSTEREAVRPPEIPPAFRPYVRPYRIGKVNWINEPGMKERIVTDFAKPLEHLTMPLGRRLYDIVKRVPWDSTFHEHRGYAQIKTKLKEGYTAYCFDLSKATDRFPFSTQWAVMLGLDFGPNYLDQLEVLEFAVKSEALLPDGSTVSWTVGQPMGYYPSFAMFSLTHGMVLMDYLYSRGIIYDNQFVVHGDDLVILDEDLANYYKQFCDVAGVNINDFKTVVSNHSAEFNSRLITKSDIIPMKKWRPVSLESLDEQIIQWGPKAIDWLPVGQTTKQRVRMILSLPGVLPNGNSINPSGVPLADRIAAAPTELLDALSTSTVNVKSFVSFRSLVLDRFRRNYFIYSHCPIEEELGTKLVLPNLLEALNIADTLDREILQDCYGFVDFCLGSTQTSSFLYRGLSSNSGLYLADSMLSLIAHLLKAFNEAFSPSDKMFTFSFIKELNCKRFKKTYSVSRLSKLVKLVNRISKPVSVHECAHAS